MQFTRYAVYVTPDPGPLADFGAAWLGWDPARAQACAAPRIDGLPLPVPDLTADPRRYGLHGTVKPPFRLASGRTPEAMIAEAQELCAQLAPVVLPGLELSRIGEFLALTALGDPVPLSQLAMRVVEGLDAFRAPPEATELARRRAAPLSPRQEEMLRRWGYPYVGDEFRFHITLTGQLRPDVLTRTAVVLRPHLAPLLPTPFAIRGLTLLGEDVSGLFHCLHRLPLAS